jgi:hypothetical protein
LYFIIFLSAEIKLVLPPLLAAAGPRVALLFGLGMLQGDTKKKLRGELGLYIWKFSAKNWQFGRLFSKTSKIAYFHVQSNAQVMKMGSEVSKSGWRGAAAVLLALYHKPGSAKSERYFYFATTTQCSLKLSLLTDLLLS